MMQCVSVFFWQHIFACKTVCHIYEICVTIKRLVTLNECYLCAFQNEKEERKKRMLVKIGEVL